MSVRQSSDANAEARFVAYKAYPHDPNRGRDGHVRNLTFAQARDETRFPLGPQKDEQGCLFVWMYGLMD